MGIIEHYTQVRITLGLASILKEQAFIAHVCSTEHSDLGGS